MALSQRKTNNQQQYNQRTHQNNNHHGQVKGTRAKGPAPQSYVFHDISNYDDENETTQNQQEQLQRENNANNFADETDFNSSCCDYQSDIFKEQPSQYIDDSNSKLFSKDNNLKESAIPGLMSLHECRSESDFKENLHGSAFQGYSSALSPNNYQSVKQTAARIDSQHSLRVNNTNTAYENQKKSSVQGNQGKLLEVSSNNGGGVSQSVKNSCDHSIISPNYRTQNNATSTTNKNSKQPFNSMVPMAINKNLNQNNKDQKQNQPHLYNKGVYSYEMNKDIKTPTSDDSADFILSGQNTIQNQNLLFNVNSFQNLTPQKYQPTPISPSQRPVQSNYGGKIVMINNQQPTPNQQQYDSRNFNNQMPSSLRTQNSGQKATVVYNEFKYYTSGADLNNTQNPQKYINIAGGQRKSDISASHISGMPAVALQYELSPGTQNNMFDVSSPKQSISNGQLSFNIQSQNGNNIRANSIRKQIFNTERNNNHNNNISQQQTILLPSLSSQNYQLQLKHENSNNTNIVQPDNNNQEAQQKIRELQNYIEQLESDLKDSQDKNCELKQKFKDKSFIQSFDKSKKHLSDTEDSLILSEKKGRKNSIQNSQNIRNSLTKQNITCLPGNNSLVIQCSSNQQSNLLSIQNTNSNSAAVPQDNTNGVPQRSSSIVDVKIRPIMNLKNYQQTGSDFSPQNLIRHSGSFAKPQINNQQQQRRNNDQESENQLEYQVQDFNDYSASQLNQSNQQDGAQQNDSEMQNQHQHLSEDECEGCERLKQLVFQAKEAIDDLKLEIEEWRDICSDKETELRQLHHRIYNDIMGVDKKIDFNSEVQTKEFDPARPVTTNDQRKVRNYINHNKNRIRSRSKTANNKLNSDNGIGFSSNTSSRRTGINIAQSIKKKSALKSVRDLASEEFEFYEAEDVGMQTSFDLNNNDKMQIQHSTEQLQTNVSIDSSTNNNKKVHYNGMQSQYTSNRRTTSPDKQNHHQYEAVSVTLKTTQPDDYSQQYLEELCTLRTKNQIQEQEIVKMRQQMGMMTGQIEKFVGLMQKAKKRNNKKGNIIDIDEIKLNHELISNIESYSILEKINEWKREEGLVDQNTLQDQEPQPTQIPRPLKLIQDIDLSELEQYDNPKTQKDNQSHQSQLQLLQQSQQQQQLLNFNNISNINNNNNQIHNNSSVLQQSVLKQHNNQYQSQMDNAQEFLQMIKTEQENIKKQTDLKYKELHKQQQDYLNVLKSV